MPSNHLILCCPLLLSPSVFPSIRVFSNESALCIRWQKYWNFSFSNSPFNEYSGLISFRIDWFDLLAVQGTLKSFLQHRNLKASILWHSVFFMVWASQGALVIKNLPANAGDIKDRFDPWIGKIPWRRKWQSTPVFLPKQFHGQRSLAGYRITKSRTRLKWLSTAHTSLWFNTHI